MDSRRRSCADFMKPIEKQISIVIRTKNEEASIGETLQVLFNQKQAPPFEIILVDSSSTDRTLAIAGGYPIKIITIPAERFTYGYSLNCGIASARGEIICSLSAHCTPVGDTWLKELVGPILSGTAHAIYGRQVPIEGINPFEEVSLWKHFPEQEKKDGRVPFSNANCAFLKHIWLKQPFDEELPSWEDYLWYLLLKDKYFFQYNTRAAVYHTHPFSLKRATLYAYRDGKTFRILKDKYGIDVINEFCPSVRSKVKTLIDDLKMHVRYFRMRGYRKKMPLIPVIRLSKYLAYWRGYRALR